MSLRKNLGAGAVREGGPPSQRWLVGSQSDPTLAEAARLYWEILSIRRRQLRIGNGHLSFRTERLPWQKHRELMWLAAVGTFWVVAWCTIRGNAARPESDMGSA
jgi:hypothetical protein